MTDPTVYTREEVARILGVHPNTITRWFAKGKIPGRKIGGRWYIDTIAHQRAASTAWTFSGEGANVARVPPSRQHDPA